MGKNEQGIDVFKINQDDAPNQRFIGVATKYKDKIVALLDQYEPYFPTVLLKAFEYLDWGIKWYHPQRYGEIEGMAQYAGIETHVALMVNYVYEFESFCTSIITRLNNGTILHMRNLDFDFPDQMRQVTYVAQYYKGGQYLYEGVMFGGLVAMQTGFRKGAFSVSLNQRTPSNAMSIIDILENVGMIFLSYNQPSWLIRDTLETCPDYQCAFERLSTEPVIAPGYFIVAGTKGNEGAIISRDRYDAANIDTLAADRWYLV